MDRKRKRHSGIEDWTAARCQRLLRPIASRILPLRRLSYITVSQKVSEDSFSTSISSEGSKINSIINHSSDPAWFPGHERRPNIKKYSSRQPQQAQGNLANKGSGREDDSLILLPTPFKARALRRGTPVKQQQGAHMLGSPSLGREKQSRNVKRTKRDPFSRAPLAKQSAELQNRQNFEKIFELHQGVSDGFSLLLQKTATTDKNVPERKGAPSLLKMCLRKIPDYIQAEEEWRKSIDEDDETDVSAEVYEELEDLGVSAGHGWPGLRDVVLAHSVKLIREIIDDKLVSMNTRAELANMPLRHGLNMEAEILAVTYSNSLPFKRPFKALDSPLFDGCLAGLRDLGFCGAESAKKGLHVRLLDGLFHSGRLHLSWLASRDMIRFSSEMIRSLASDSGDNADIVGYIYGRVSQICRVELDKFRRQTDDEPRSAPASLMEQIERPAHNTIISTITVLTAIVLIERNAHESYQGQGSASLIESLLNSIAITILRKLYKCKTQKRNSPRAKGSSQHNGVCFAVLASALILRINPTNSDNDEVRLSRGEILQGLDHVHNSDSSFGNGSATMIERAALYTCDLARCCGQSLSSSGLEYLQDLVQCLMEQSEDRSTLENTLLRQLALESSLYFAKTSATKKSRVFMENIESAMLRQEPLQIDSPDVARNQKSSPTKRKGLRWEEGLCEWIAATPLITTKSRGVAPAIRASALQDDCIEEESDIHDSGYVSPLQETPAPRKKMRRMSDLVTSPDVLGMTPGFLAQVDVSFEAQEMASGSPKAKLRERSKQPQVEHHKDSRSRAATSRAVPTIAAEKAPPPRFEISNSRPKNSEKKRGDIINSVASNDLQHDSATTDAPTQAVTEVADRPKKRRRSHKPDSMPAESSSASTLDTSHSGTTPMPNVESTRVIEDDDEDELAMSCKKPRQQRPQVKTSTNTARPAKLQKRTSYGSKRALQSDASEDELGG